MSTTNMPRKNSVRVSADPNREWARLMLRYLDENPFRALVSLSGGAFPYGVASALLMIANGTYVLGIGRLGLELRRMMRRKKHSDVSESR